MPNRIVLNIIYIQTEKQLGTLNSIQVLLKGVLTDVHARNFMHAKTFACTLHAYLSPCAQFVKPCNVLIHIVFPIYFAIS